VPGPLSIVSVTVLVCYLGVTSISQLMLMRPIRHSQRQEHFADFSFPINPIGRDGIVRRCLVRIKDDAALGVVTLECENANATSALGVDLPTRCDPGSLTIVGQEVITSPGDHTGTPGEIVEFALASRGTARSYQGGDVGDVPRMLDSAAPMPGGEPQRWRC
jgi:hypothetical protein